MNTLLCDFSQSYYLVPKLNVTHLFYMVKYSREAILAFSASLLAGILIECIKVLIHYL